MCLGRRANTQAAADLPQDIIAATLDSSRFAHSLTFGRHLSLQPVHQRPDILH
jgi:hypothetical protein